MSLLLGSGSQESKPLAPPCAQATRPCREGQAGCRDLAQRPATWILVSLLSTFFKVSKALIPTLGCPTCFHPQGSPSLGGSTHFPVVSLPKLHPRLAPSSLPGPMR